MADLTKGDWTRLAILCAWALTWTPIPAVALDKLLTDPWDVFGSIATAGATLVALWFGSAEGRHRKQQETRAAGIYRWVFGAEIATLKTALSEIELTASLVESADDGDGLMPDTKPYMESVAGLLELPTLGAHLDKLPDLPTSFAQPLAALYGHSRGLSRSARVLVATPEINAKKRKLATSMRRRSESMRKTIDSIDWPKS